MDKIIINGGIPLKGEVKISGSKNAALPLMAACLLTGEPLRLSNIPHLVDISTMASLLGQHGVEVRLDGSASDGGHNGEVILLQAETIANFEAPYDIVRKMRASVLVLGPLLARFGHARVSMPGGCAIGTRPIDLHLKALEKMGAEITLAEGYIEAKVKGRLRAAEIDFEKVSVGATENILMAATLAEGTTIINNAACEPEITDLANCLIKMGADIKGAGTPRIAVKGKKSLAGAEYSVIADRIEAGTYMVAAAITGGDITITGLEADIVHSIIDKLEEAGVDIKVQKGFIRVKRKAKAIKGIDITTRPYPGFPTDMQAQLMALMSIAEGTSVISENIFENRFMHVPELHRMGADIKIKGNTAVVRGVKGLKGAQVMATDLRASVSMVLAALAAKGQTHISRIYHLDRGYERIEEKLSTLGADIKRVRG